eukprot:g10787.t1
MPKGLRLGKRCQLHQRRQEDGFGYSPALLTLASLYESGYEPAIQQDAVQAARYYISLLEVQITSPSLSRDLLEEAATHLCSLAKDPSCNLPDNEVRRLEALAAEERSTCTFCGQCRILKNRTACEDGQPSSAWLTFAAAEARRRWTEANEDPEVRKRRQQREAQKAEQRQRMLTEQRQRAQQALSEAEELRLQGNDVCRQGQLPGNAAAQQLLLQEWIGSVAVALYDQAVEVLSRCLEQSLPAEESSELRKQRALLRSNSAQVELSAERWAQAAKLAELSLKDQWKLIRNSACSAVLSQVDESKEEDVAAILAAAPKEVCLGGYPSGDQFLWFRGGNWGVTDSLKASALAAPWQPEPSMDPAETSKDQGTTSANNLPSWVAETAVDVEDKELRVNVVFPPDLSIPLPVKLSEEQREAPKAKWSEKTRTLKVRFVLD